MQTRWRTLFRADGLGELTGTDLAVLRELGIRTVIDLRSGSELERGRFDVDAHPVAFHHFPFIDELPDAEDFDRRPGLLGTQYLEIVRDAGGQILAALEVLAAPDALPAVFHCTAGKDRTGVLSAIVLSLLGVDEPTVVADYALSGEAMQRLRAKLIAQVPRGPRRRSRTSTRSSRPTRRRWSRCSTTSREHYGSVDAYVAGSAPGRRWSQGLRAALLEPTASSRPRRRPPGCPGRRRSMTPARARSSRVMPPESCVVRTRRTVFQRMSMSGWWLAASAAAPTALTNASAAAKSCSLTVVDELVALAGPVQAAAPRASASTSVGVSTGSLTGGSCPRAAPRRRTPRR